MLQLTDNLRCKGVPSLEILSAQQARDRTQPGLGAAAGLRELQTPAGRRAAAPHDRTPHSTSDPERQRPLAAATEADRPAPGAPEMTFRKESGRDMAHAAVAWPPEETLSLWKR